jgi:hypothetical protein
MIVEEGATLEGNLPISVNTYLRTPNLRLSKSINWLPTLTDVLSNRFVCPLLVYRIGYAHELYSRAAHS